MQGWSTLRVTAVAAVLVLLAQRAAAQTPRTLTLRLPDGRAAAAARVVPGRGKELLAVVTCDEQGRVTLPDADGVDHVIVVGPAALPCDIPLDAAASEIVLPLVPLAGRLVVDGAAPAQPVTVWMLPKIEHGVPLFASRELAKALGPPPLRQPTALTGADGHFDFGLVQDGLTYWVGAPRGYAPPPPSISSEPIVVVDRPSTDVLLAVHALPLIVGRVFGPDGQPAANVTIQIEAKTQDPSGSIGNGGTTGDDGRFEVAIADKPRASCDIRFEDRATGARGMVSLGAGSGSADLRDVRLAPSEAVRLLAQDPQGHPLEGAVARTPDGKAHSEAAGADGLICFDKRIAGENSLRVERMAYEGRDVSIDVHAAEPIVVVLKPMNSLTLDILTPDGRPAPKLQLRLRAKHGLFASPGYTIQREQERLGATAVNGCNGPTTGLCLATAYLEQGHAVLTGLVEDATVEVEVQDRCGFPVRAKETITVRAGDQAARRWVLDRSPRDVTIEVRGPDGVMRRDVVPRLECLDATTQDGEGRMVVTDVFADELSFEIRPPPTSGLGRAAKLPRAIPASGLMVVDLVAARTLLVEVTDAAGTAVDASVRLGDPWSGMPEPQRTAPGRFAFAGLGADAVDVSVDFSGQVWKQHADTAGPVVRVEVPATGRLRGRLTSALENGSDWYAAVYTSKTAWAGMRPLPAGGLAAGDVVDLGLLVPGDYVVALRHLPLRPERFSATLPAVRIEAGETGEAALAPEAPKAAR